MSTDAERRKLKSDIEMIRADLSIHRERLARKPELLASCEDECLRAATRLRDAQKRLSSMIADIEAAPGIIEKGELEIDALMRRIATLDNSERMAKALDLAKQIQQLRDAGFVIIPPGGAQ